MTLRRLSSSSAAVAALLTGLAGLAAPYAAAAEHPTATADSKAAAHRAAAAPATLDTLSRFFARDGKVSLTAAAPRIQGDAVPVYTLSPEFVAGRAGASVAKLEYLASTAVSSDGQKASLWTVPQGTTWKVVNIATGDDEARYAAAGASRLPGGTVFQEPQINAWYVQKGATVLPLDEDAVRAVGAKGTTLGAYQKRVQRAYGDKLPGSAYAKSGKAGGYGQSPEEARAQAAATATGGHGALTATSVTAGAGALAALGLGTVALRRRRGGNRA
ncbi:hypothetical protein [Streptomyces sp. BPTC-684]|uniref:hypothetical protein n=1 Tax=Streptomyces sp. BPTC-684 TaxID=3043734 RepID=UPI0024B14DA8|nr:hypothetical protein [Streptomyces sp. BPTC-684]WHM41427.1 hypothetical protein QIY60_21935 [Streptomyces sp. BPTC-684]